MDARSSNTRGHGKRATEPAGRVRHAAQADWRDDPKKCTFIVLAAGDGDAAAATDSATAAAAAAAKSDPRGAAHAEGGADAAQCGDHCDQARMIGDVNLFFGADHDDPAAAEVEVMIAEAAYRRRGYAREAVAMLMRYGVESLGVSRYFCKIGEDNAGSLRLFETLGFERCNYAPAFREVELQFCPGKHPMPAAPMAVVDAPDLDTLTAEDNGQQSL
eukprot:TRINITY_DN1593_c0_g1_i4.p1 TRINITY_DN1593_c0_g1~~TRINITY_DN1593_c0_g1_i4.p1  ORF type:complete len:217 (-),score=75.79 TRINITY_DN1593_c0_g1_i4:22-672(-)